VLPEASAVVAAAGAHAVAALPDIGAVLGEYTYLASEVVFGAAALALLVRADAIRRAAVTIAVLYPVAYVWDWYTLTIGVFEIPLRTGVELLGIPIEEHLFIVVVPAFVLGIHENVHAVRADELGSDADAADTADAAADAVEDTPVESAGEHRSGP